MIKKLIFDIDNTIIMWKAEYLVALEETLKEFKIDFDTKAVDNIIDDLEHNHEKLSKEILLSEINEKCNLNLDINFVNKFFERQNELSEQDQEVQETLDYLSKKYELVVLSNWFTEIQEGRLKKAGIRKYFKDVIGGDIVLKPYKEAFLKAIGSNKVEECVMIGDNIKSDIEGAISVGMKVIACDYLGKIPDSDEYIKIKKFSELKDIL